MAGELESDSVALERIREYEDLPQEASWYAEGGLPEDWPSSGDISFQNFSTRYRPDLPPVLDNFQLDVKDKSKAEALAASGEAEDERCATPVAAKTLCIPFDQPPLPEGTPCFASGKPAKCWVLWGRSY